MNDRLKVKQISPGTNGQTIVTIGGVVVWGNSIATTSTVGDVQLATQTQSFQGSPDTSSGNPLVTQPSGMILRRNFTTSETALIGVSATGSAEPTPNTRGVFTLDIQSQRTASTQIASGDRSIAIGLKNTTAGTYSTTVGYLNTNSCLEAETCIVGSNNTNTAGGGGFGVNSKSGIFGNNNTNNCQKGFIFGSTNTVNNGVNGTSIIVCGNSNASGTIANSAGIFGHQNTGTGDASFIFGKSNTGNDSAQSLLMGNLNSITSTGTQNAAIGFGNNISNVGNDPSSSIAVGISNAMSAGTIISATFGITNSIVGNGARNVAVGTSNTINAGASNSGVFGHYNGVPASASNAFVIGKSNGGGGNNSFVAGSLNSSQGCPNVIVVGAQNTTSNNGLGTFASYCSVFGIGNAIAATSLSVVLSGQSNSTGGHNVSIFGYNNTAGSGNQNVLLGNTNTISTSSTNVVLVGVNNATGNGGIDGSSSVIVGKDNLSLNNCNIFGHGNFKSFNIFGTGNANNTNCFGESNYAGSNISNCEIFGTGNSIGNTGTGFNPDTVYVFGRNNTTNQSNGLIFGKNNTVNNQTASLTESQFNAIFGFSNTVGNYSSNCLVAGRNNSVLQLTGSAYSTIYGYQNQTGWVYPGVGGNNFGAYSVNGNSALAMGFKNAAASDNSAAIGYGNFSGPNGVSSLAIGVLNNNDRTIAFVSDTTGVVTGTPTNLGQFQVGINSIAVGSENHASGLNSVAVGRRNDALATEASAFGVRCQATAQAATAIGNRAIARVANTLNIGGLPIIRKDNGEAAGTEFTSFSGMPAIIESKLIDFKIAQIYSIQLPIGPYFWIDELGIEVVSKTGTITATPYVSWGTVVNGVYSQSYKLISQMTGLSVAGTREPYTTFLKDSGETSDNSNTVSLAARIEVAATGTGTMMGRFWWKGRYVEQ